VEVLGLIVQKKKSPNNFPNPAAGLCGHHTDTRRVRMGFSVLPKPISPLYHLTHLTSLQYPFVFSHLFCPLYHLTHLTSLQYPFVFSHVFCPLYHLTHLTSLQYPFVFSHLFCPLYHLTHLTSGAKGLLKNRLFLINVIGDWLLVIILTQMGQFPPCRISGNVNKPCTTCGNWPLYDV
jgi:hypothetical protein